MKKIHANQGPQLTMDVSDREREVAKLAKKKFKKILKELTDALNIVYDLRDAIVEEHPTKEDLRNKYKGRLLRYKRKIAETFNSLLLNMKSAIESVNEITDPDMAHLKKIIMAEFDELSDSIESMMDLLSNPDREGFTKNLERIGTQLVSRNNSISEIIDHQLFNRLENDVLGKFKVSSPQFKTRIHKRIRLLRKISRRQLKWDL